MRWWWILLLVGCGSPSSSTADLAPAVDLSVIADLPPSPYDGTYACKREDYRNVSCSPMFFALDYVIRIAGDRVEFVGHGSCTGQWQGSSFSCPVQQFDHTCTYPDALFIIDAALDAGASGEIAAGVPSDLASSAHCTKQ